MGIKEKTIELRDELIQLRRDFHQHPELGFQEYRTADKIEEYLKNVGLEVSRITETAVVGLLNGDQPGPILMIRADMDALPIQEMTSVAYKSINEGKMHACGHDGHVAMLMVAAKILSDYRAEINGIIKFIFQPNEEGDGGGAKFLIEKGVLNDPKVDAAMGIHLMSELKTGEIGVSAGPVMADANIFRLTVSGEGGHTAVSHKSIDPIITAANIIQTTQIIQTREINVLKPTSIVFGKIKSGTAPNIIPKEVELEGTIRCLYDSLADDDENPCLKFERIVKNVCQSHRAQYTLELEYSNPAVINDLQMANLVKKEAEKAVDTKENILPFVTMIGEDFGDFGNKVPSAFYFIGVGNKEKSTVYSHHHPYFNIDENALPLGVEMHVRSALAFFRDYR